LLGTATGARGVVLGGVGEDGELGLDVHGRAAWLTDKDLGAFVPYTFFTDKRVCWMTYVVSVIRKALL
jgi:hypothetical protein